MQRLTDPAPLIGLSEGIRDTTYFGINAINSGLLTAIRESPLHGRSYLDEEEREVTAAMLIGTITHQLVLEPDKPLTEWRLAIKPPGMKFNTKDGKQWRDNQLARRKLILTEDEYVSIFGMAKAALAHPEGKDMLLSGKGELTAVWKDEQTGMFGKALMDWVPPGDALIDLKTTYNSAPALWERHAFNMGYNLQAAWYLRGWNASVEDQYRKTRFINIVAERKAPYDVVLFEWDQEELDAADKQIDVLLARWKTALDTSVYPGRCSTIYRINNPRLRHAGFTLEA